MKADELIKALVDNGADEAGIADRFGGNDELYERCFQEFLDIELHASLKQAIKEKNYSRAFEDSHALKGLSGNLGLTSYYKSICALVETLRGTHYENAEADFVAAEADLKNLKLIFEEKQPLAPPNEDKDEKTLIKLLKDKKLLVALASILAVFVVATVSFYFIGSNYRTNTKIESGMHLLETGSQVAVYIQEKIENDWHIADSIAENFVSGSQLNDDALLEILTKQHRIFGVSDLMIYTEDGYCVYSDGKTLQNDTASQTVAQAQQTGKFIAIIESDIIYTIPVETDKIFNDSKIVAISVVRSMETLLSELEFASFDNTAWLYLTDNNGIVISSFSGVGATYTFNVNTLFKDNTLNQLNESFYPQTLFSPSKVAFYMDDGEKENDKYVVSVPILTSDSSEVRMYLFYFVPEKVVNSSSNTFSGLLTFFSVIVVGSMGLLASVAFLAIYRDKKRQFDKAMSAREQMFDLLIQNMRTVFALFNSDNPEPAFISANAPEILGERYWTVVKDVSGYRMRSASGEESEIINDINALLENWDGTNVFKSGFLTDSRKLPPAYFECVIYPVGNNGKEFVGLVQDVTVNHEREDAVKNALEMAKRSNEAKTRFLANMSHDIRTPMNAIMNMSSFALESGIDSKRRTEYLTTIRESSEHLLHLINDILDMSRIESGQTIIASEPFDIRAELLSQAEVVKPLCTAKKLTFIIDFDSLKTRFVRGDGLKVSQIVVNLLSNAIKFTPEGGAVRFSVTELPSLRHDTVNLRFVVEDNGIGIAKENMKHIFEPFSRANDKRIVNIEGTGLGLSIVRSYVEAMGGTINCESEEGEGSIFTVELFFERADTVLPEASVDLDVYSNKPFLGMRCLVVEDIATNRAVAKTMLEKIGFSVDLANDGSEGAQKFFSARAHTYDIIYMDVQMPVLDGYQATAAIRNSSHPQAKTVPIVAMSANVFVEDIEKARIVGMDGYIGKPIVILDLIEQTVKAVNKKG